jgi:ubiquinone/menaquinone biosynthesis C-methylase UbiE
LPGDPEFWQKRYIQQVRWTLATRSYIFNKTGISPSRSILEVGCGSGAVLESLKSDGFSNIIGLDIDLQALRLIGSKNIINADAFTIPFPINYFDISLCHFFLLWVKDPFKALKEMMRITKTGGWVIALAEPDYGGRIDFPEKLEKLGKTQLRALREQGADVYAGRKLKSYFNECNLENMESGIISAQWTQGFDNEDFEMEWSVMRKDLKCQNSPEELARYYQIDLKASRQGKRVLFVPIFYAFGQVPD